MRADLGRPMRNRVGPNRDVLDTTTACNMLDPTASAAMGNGMVDRTPMRCNAVLGNHSAAMFRDDPAPATVSDAPADGATTRHRHRDVLPATRNSGDRGSRRCAVGLIHVKRAALSLRDRPPQRPGLIAEIVRDGAGRVEVFRAGAVIGSPRPMHSEGCREAKQQGYPPAAGTAEHGSLYRMTLQKGRKNES